MIEIKVEGARRVSLFLDKLDEKVARAAKEVVDRQSKAMTAYIRMRHLVGGPSKDRLARRTGQLYRGTKPKRTRVLSDRITGGTRFGAWYASVHVGRKGKRTTIVPKRREHLAVPLTGAKTRTGRLRGRPRDFPGTFLLPSKGKLLVAQRKGRRGVLPLFILKKQVSVPTRIHPEEIGKVMLPRIVKDLKAELDRRV